MKKRLVVLSGAGISAESGISTFRDTDGLWENFAIEDVATPEAWKRNPHLVQQFYNDRRTAVIAAQPNEAHAYFARIQERYDVHIITQNIDDLHERAGNENILHLHGNIRYSKSSGTQQEKEYYRIEGKELKMDQLCPDGFPLRPHVVWFGEDVPLLQAAAELVSTASILVVIGTSLNVYPAAGLIHAAPLDCRRFVIDPKVNELPIDQRFIKIAETAVLGVQTLDSILLSEGF